MVNAKITDAGRYSCLPSSGDMTNVTVHVVSYPGEDSSRDQLRRMFFLAGDKSPATHITVPSPSDSTPNQSAQLVSSAFLLVFTFIKMSL